MPDEYISLSEAARRLGKDRVATFHRFAASNLPKYKVGRAYLVRLEDVAALWAKAKTTAVEA
jgi:hypothetical protein